MASFKEEFFDDLSRIRGIPSGDGTIPLSFIEKTLGTKVPVQFWEPDPTSSHTEYYYNARQNVLYKRKRISKIKSIWISVATV